MCGMVPRRSAAPEGDGAEAASEIAAGIAVRVDSAREQSRLALADVGAAVGRTRQWVSDIEAGRVIPRADHLALLAEVLGVDAGWLLLGERSDTDFVAAMRALEPRLDDRGRRTVLTLARAEAEAAAAYPQSPPAPRLRVADGDGRSAAEIAAAREQIARSEPTTRQRPARPATKRSRGST